MPDGIWYVIYVDEKSVEVAKYSYCLVEYLIRMAENGIDSY